MSVSNTETALAQSGNTTALAVTVPLLVFVLTQVYIRLRDQKKRFEKVAALTGAASDELRFYVTKCAQLADEAERLAVVIMSDERVILPSYSLYPDFLQRLRVETAIETTDREIAQMLGDCQFELSHIIERLEIQRNAMAAGPPTATAQVRPWRQMQADNWRGLQALVLQNRGHFATVADRLEAAALRFRARAGRLWMV